jgi:peptidoglycan/LPS O-acetylase OafA/YrhL
VLAGAWSTGERALPWLRTLSRTAGGSWLLAAACFYLSARLQPEDLFLPRYGMAAHLLTGLGCGLLVLPTLAGASGATPRGLARALERRTMIWLGTVSYGIYLWHVPLLQAVSARMAPGLQSPPASAAPGTALWLFAIVALLAAGAGAASWYLVEQPSRRLLAVGGARGRAHGAAAKTV